MSNKEELTTPCVRQVVVDIATHDDDGNPITDAMLSSGGARDRGPLLKQYTNPRPYESAPVRSSEERGLDLHMQREAALRQRREHVAEEQRLYEDRERARALLQLVFEAGEWVLREAVAPWVKRKWDERKAQKLVLRDAEMEGTAVVDFAAHNDRAVVVVESGAVIMESVASEDTHLAPVAQIEDYRRSA